MIKNKSLHRALLILAILFILLPSSCFAAGDGSGNGNSKGLGENKDIPLTLKSCSIKNNDDNVHLNETIQLNFNKNVCNVTVLSNNKMCFHLTDESGSAVAIKLIFPDTQVQQEHKREVFIIPAENLEPNSQYRISVDNTLKAKNGVFIDKAHTVTFNTGTELTDEENSILKALGENIITYEASSDESSDSAPINVSDLDDISDTTEPELNTAVIITAAVLLVLILVFTVLFILFKRRK